MNKRLITITFLVAVLFSGCNKNDNKIIDVKEGNTVRAEKKVLFVNSYHDTHTWSSKIVESARNILNPEVQFQVFYMNTKTKKTEEEISSAALEAKKLIETWEPDLIITSDDNAMKYLVVPYYKNAAIPIVFCGINHDSSQYGLPFNNVTGMVSWAPFDFAINTLARISDGNKVAFIDADTITTTGFENSFKRENLDIDVIRVSTFDEWKAKILEIQDNYSILLYSGNQGIEGWDDDEAEKFIYENIRIPIGTTSSWMVKFSVLGFFSLAEEQGEYVANTALKILEGQKPVDFPIISNHKARIQVNMKLANKLNIKIPVDILEMANYYE
jgi:ABC transporter substrate binding protein